MTTTPKPAKPAILTDTYGQRAPDAAKFGVGASDRPGIERATEARRDQRPGQYRNDAAADVSRKYNQAPNG
jgi:hypothetical protein